MKLYERTENGTTAIVSLEDGVAEAERASTDRRNVPSMSSRGGRHHLEYRDGRIVDLVLVDAPAEEPKTALAAPAGRTFTVIYTGGGEPIVHAAGCSHNVRDSFQGVHTTEQVTGSLEDVAAYVYADMIDEDEALTGEDFISELTVKPCAR
ncbi:hypothetical protein ACFXGR_22425 [Streptomyces mirabilis]|uniref:hypothetical protein n=1 Tax=Streptomyces mirabilis TaxID=68239 RepID=UPI0036CA8E1B